MSLCIGLLLFASGFAGKVPLEGFVIVMVAFGLIGAARTRTFRYYAEDMCVGCVPQFSEGNVVRAEGVEPSQAFAARMVRSFRIRFAVWTIPSPSPARIGN
jgi:hypothetical protein